MPLSIARIADLHSTFSYNNGSLVCCETWSQKASADGPTQPFSYPIALDVTVISRPNNQDKYRANLPKFSPLAGLRAFDQGLFCSTIHDFTSLDLSRHLSWHQVSLPNIFIFVLVVFVVWEGFLANFQKVHTSRRQLIHAREESKQMLRIGSSVSGKCSNPAALAIDWIRLCGLLDNKFSSCFHLTVLRFIGRSLAQNHNRQL